MNKQFFTLSFCLIVSLSLFGTSTTKETPTPKALESIFRIQIGAFSNPQVAQFKSLSKIGYVYQEKGAKNVKRIFIGQYTDKALATNILSEVHAMGFQDAFVDKIDLSTTKMTYLVQLGAYELVEVEWEKFQQFDNLYMQFAGNRVKLLVGTFGTLTAVNQKLNELKEKGFSGVFIKHTNEALIHKVTDFEVVLNNQLQPTPATEMVSKTGEKLEPKSKAQPTKQPIAGATYPATKSKGFNPTQAPSEPNSTAFANVNRSSVSELKKALQSSDTYQGKVDGSFDKNIDNALATYATKNNYYKSYNEVAKQPRPILAMKGGEVQTQIDLIPTNAEAASKRLSSIKEPMAKAYLAYLYYTDKVKIDNVKKVQQVNQLMNEAIGETFLDKQFKGVSKLDYYKTYMYDDLETLILHIGYLHDASTEEMAIPCWMIEEHPKETAKMLKELQLPLTSNCGDFMDWKEIRLVKEAAKALDPVPEYEKGDGARTEIQMYAARRSQLYITPKISSDDEAQLIEEWHTLLWNAIEKNEANIKNGKKTVAPFKVAYYQALVKLENHYLGRGYKPEEARLFALDVLRSVVNYHVGSYIAMN